MNILEEALKIAADTLLDVNGTEVTISGQRYTASISYSSDLGLQDFSERQKSVVMLSIDDFATEPAQELEITEFERGTIHRIKKVEFQGVAWACECEFRHHQKTGPFK